MRTIDLTEEAGDVTCSLSHLSRLETKFLVMDLIEILIFCHMNENVIFSP